MTVQEFIKATGMTHKQLSERFGIPKRTIEDWSRGVRKCPDYVVKMMEEILKGEKTMFKLPKNEAIVQIDFDEGCAEIVTTGGSYFVKNPDDIKKIREYLHSAEKHVCPEGVETIDSYRTQYKIYDLVKWMMNKAE